MSFKSHLEMISLNETPSKKAKFWQSFVRSLKGTSNQMTKKTPEKHMIVDLLQDPMI